MEFEAQKEAIELPEIKRQQAFSLKMKKLEIVDQASSRGIVSSASGSLRFRHGKRSSCVSSMENKFNYHLEKTLDDKPAFSEYNEPPCSSKQADARMESLATSKPSAQCFDVKPRKSLKFHATVFVPGNASVGAVKTVAPTPAPFSTLTLASTLAVLPRISVSMKLPKLFLDKFDGNPLEWPEWSGQFLAAIEGSGASDSDKMQYLKSLVTGKAKAVTEGMGFLVRCIK